MCLVNVFRVAHAIISTFIDYMPRRDNLIIGNSLQIVKCSFTSSFDKVFLLHLRNDWIFIFVLIELYKATSHSKKN